jgi:hypothetical protein
MHQDDRDHYNKNNQDEYKCMTLITLITSFYLNLAQNDENRDLLLKLRLFEKLSNLMDPYSSSKAAKSFLAVANTKSQTSLVYTNTIFAKLLKFKEARSLCIEEGGHNLFIHILQDSQKKHLYLETLDSVKLFLTKREYLSKFKRITE